MDVPGASAWEKFFNELNNIQQAHAKLHAETRQSSPLEDTVKCTEDPRSGSTIMENTPRLNSNSHDSDMLSRVPRFLPYVPESAADIVYVSKQGSSNAFGDSGAALAKAASISDPLPADEHPDTEFGDDSVPSRGLDYRTEVTSVHEEASHDGEDGLLSEEEASSLSLEKKSTKSESGGGYDSTGERSVIDCSYKAFILRLMDEFCSSILFQVSCRSRRHGQHGQSPPDSSENTQTSVSATASNNNGPAVTRGKWARKNDEGPEDEDDGKPKRRRVRESASSNDPFARVRYFACPFHKLDKSIYSNCNDNPRLALKYRSCGPPGWPTIGKMK